MGMHNAVLLLFKKAPPKIASAKIGVKFGGCGKILVKETRKIIYYEYNTKYPHAGAGKRIEF